jgi:TonB family protein
MLSLLFTVMIRKIFPSLVMFAALIDPTRGFSADRAAVLIDAVSQKAQATVTWESEGQLVADNVGPATGTSPGVPFRISLEYPSDGSTGARARLEILGGGNPLVRICDGHFQWNYLPAGRYWKLAEPEIDPCVYPFSEWRSLALYLRAPVIVGSESLKVAQRTIKCTVVRGDFGAPGEAPTSSRKLWIDDISKMVWQYRVERTNSLGEHTVQTYSLLWQTLDGLRRSSDLFQFQPLGWTELAGPPMELSRAAEEHLTKTATELPTSMYRIGGVVTPPALIHKVEPKYTKAAQSARMEGTVKLAAEVQIDGTARNIRVTQSLDPGLDRQAIEAVSQWRFRPGVRDGNPVAVAVVFEVNFRLR